MLFFWSLMFGALAISERCIHRLIFAIAALSAVAATLLMIVGDLERATLLTVILAAAIIGASKVKHHQSGIKLTAADRSLIFAGIIRFLLVQYPRVAATSLTAAGALVPASCWTIQKLAGPPIAIEYRLSIFAIAVGACLIAYRASGGADTFRSIVTYRYCFFSRFFRIAPRYALLENIEQIEPDRYCQYPVAP